jgi:hypothetical protein
VLPLYAGVRICFFFLTHPHLKLSVSHVPFELHGEEYEEFTSFGLKTSQLFVGSEKKICSLLCKLF